MDRCGRFVADAPQVRQAARLRMAFLISITRAVFCFELVSIRKAKIGKHVAGTLMNFNATKQSGIRFRDAFQKPRTHYKLLMPSR